MLGMPEYWVEYGTHHGRMAALLLLASLPAPAPATIIQNGDFEGGGKAPWLCRGCQGHVL